MVTLLKYPHASRESPSYSYLPICLTAERWIVSDGIGEGNHASSLSSVVIAAAVTFTNHDVYSLLYC